MTEKKDYEVAVEAFTEADKKYVELRDKVLTGEWIAEAGKGKTIDHYKSEWLTLLQQLRDAMDDRNAKLKTAQGEMREAVKMNETQWRGPDGESTKLKCGPFDVSSMTNRSFDAESLLSLAREHGLYERILELQMVKKDGSAGPAVQQVWDVDYSTVHNWLKGNNLVNILDGAYDESEATPHVYGPKPVAFLGDEIKSK